jgi:pimeloyl-ACP methyl ester carboxylesterase
MRKTIMAAGLAFSCAIALAAPAHAVDMATTRSVEQLIDEVIKRASQTPPRSMVAGMKIEDVKAALSNIKTLDRDEWARAWMSVADRYMEEGRKLEKAGRIAPAREAFLKAYRYYKFGHYPVDNSPEKAKSYQKGVEAFLAYARYLEPKLEVVRIPFEGKEIVGYLRLPKAKGKVPLVYLATALDSRKEEWTERNEDYLKAGIGIFLTDMPGTGQAPIKGSEIADRMFKAALDYLAARPEIDAQRIGFYGGSWSSYWAVKLAVTERARLRAVVSQGTGVHEYFSAEWQRVAVNTEEYLMDLLPARSSVYGVEGLDAFLAFGPKMSLKAQGLLDKPSAPMLLVNGSRDTQMPIADLFLAAASLKGGPVETWVNPAGGHMGNDSTWPSERIRKEIVAPWMIKMLKAPEPATKAAAR